MEAPGNLIMNRWRLGLWISALALGGPLAPATAQPSTKIPSVEELKVFAQAMTAETRVLVAPVFDDVAAERARQASLAPPATLAERLTRMGALDQSVRRRIGGIPLGNLAPDQRKAASSALGAAMAEVDKENQAALLAVIPQEGWFAESKVGKDASTAAFLIVQHADLDVQRRFLPVLERFAVAGEASPGNYALMYDRVALREGRPQRFGTQLTCQNGRWAPAAIEAPEQLEARRATMKLPTMSEYLKGFEQRTC